MPMAAIRALVCSATGYRSPMLRGNSVVRTGRPVELGPAMADVVFETIRPPLRARRVD
jgi:vacuolar-type H+-ATPase catalytic subunit A/Vma1